MLAADCCVALPFKPLDSCMARLEPGSVRADFWGCIKAECMPPCLDSPLCTLSHGQVTALPGLTHRVNGVCCRMKDLPRPTL